MRLMDEILEKEPKIYKNKTPFFQLENIDIEAVTKSLFESITNKIPIDKKNGYRNENSNATFKHPESGKSNENKNVMTATKRKKKDGTFYFYAEPEPNIERMIKLAWNKYKKDGECENQFPVPDTAKKGINIDLLIKKDDSIEFIELKQWNNGDNPAFAIAEIIKNLYVFSHFYKHLFAFKDYVFKKDFDIENYRKLYNLEGKNKFILTILAPEKYYEEYFKHKKIKDKKTLKENYIKFCARLKQLVQEDLRKELNKKDLEIEIRILSFEFSRKKYESIKNDLIEDKKAKNLKRFGNELEERKRSTGATYYSTGDIDLNKYFDKYFPENVCKPLITWSDYVKIT